MKSSREKEPYNTDLYRILLDAFRNPVYLVDAKKEEIIISNAVAKSRNIIEGMSYNSINYGIIESSELSKNSLLKKIKKAKKPLTTEYASNDASGNIVYCELRGYPIFNKSGNVFQTVECITDITEQKKSQEELVKLSQAVKQSLNIVMITDKDSVIEYVNPKFTEITGYTFQEIVGKKATDLGDTTGEERKIFWETLKTEGEWRGEFHNRKKNGQYYWEYASINSIKNSLGIVTHYIKDGVNISKRKQAEEELKAAKEKAEQASRFKSEFLANMSHEIKTPLNSILGFIELLSMTDLDAQQKDYFSIIKDSSRVLLGTIDDILDFSKIEIGKLEIDNINFSMVREIEPVIDMFSARADEKNIELLYFIDPNIPQNIFGDLLRIKQVLNNLISNAVKFTHKGGKILVEIKLSEASDNLSRINFSVSDNGIGIPENKQDKIFKAFFQADSSVSRKYGGTGLGLAISSQLVRLMGGDLKVESRIGEGTKFYFELAFSEFSGVNNLKRDYNFEGIRCYLFIRDEDDKIQLLNIERYLKAFNVKTQKISNIVAIKGADDPNSCVIFMNYSSASHGEIKDILNSIADKPVILIANRLDKDLITTINCNIVRAIYKPIYASKIIGAIIEILYNKYEKKSPEAGDEEYTRTQFSADALVAEDNLINQKLIYIMLKELGLNADITNNGLELLDKFENKKYDIILMDVNMPIMDGFETTANILKKEKLRELKHTPIIALTARTIRGDKEQILNSGMDDYISKPVSIEKLYNALNKYLKGKEVTIKNMDTIKNDSENSKPDMGYYDLAGTANELGVGIDFLKDLMQQFITNFESYFTSISGCINNLDFDALYSEAHKLKGTALNLRLNKLADYFLEMENNAKNRNYINYGDILNLVKVEFSFFKENFLKEL